MTVDEALAMAKLMADHTCACPTCRESLEDGLDEAFKQFEWTVEIGSIRFKQKGATLQ